MVEPKLPRCYYFANQKDLYFEHQGFDLCPICSADYSKIVRSGEPTLFEQTFKNIDDTLRKDAGCSSELDYIEQTSWVLFLKYLDDLEKDRQTAAELSGKKYTNIISPEYRWEIWAAPKNGNGKIDFHKALTGDDLKDFVDQRLYPYLRRFKTEAKGPDTIEYKIGEIFNELKNKIQSGYNLREVINLVDELRFRSSAEKHEMSALYEDKIKNMGNAGRNGGEYYTPRPLIKLSRLPCG